MSVNIYRKTDGKLITVASQYKLTNIDIVDNQQINFLTDKSKLPIKGENNKLYITTDNGYMYVWNNDNEKYNYIGSNSTEIIEELSKTVADVNDSMKDMSDSLQWKNL